MPTSDRSVIDAEDVVWAFTPAHRRWARIGVSTFGEMQRWEHAGGTIEEASAWYSLANPGIDSPLRDPLPAHPLFVATIQPLGTTSRTPPSITAVGATIRDARDALCSLATRHLGEQSTGYGPLDVVRCYAAIVPGQRAIRGEVTIDVHGLVVQSPGEIVVVTVYDYGPLRTHVAATETAAQDWLERYVAERCRDLASRPSIDEWFAASHGRYTINRCAIPTTSL